MKTLQYWGTGNFQEQPYTGRIVTWTEKEKQTIDDAIATKLLAANVGFVLDNDNTGEVVTSQINPLTGGISYLQAAGRKIYDDAVFLGRNSLTESASVWLPWKSGTTFASTNQGGGSYAFDATEAYPRIATFSVSNTATDYVQVNNTGLSVKPPQLAYDDLLLVPCQITSYPTTTGTSITVSIAVSSDNFATKSGGMTGYLLPSRVDGWSLAVVPVSTFTSGNGQLLSDQFNWVGVKITNSAGGGACTVKVGGIWKYTPKRATLVIQFDDAFSSVYTDAYPAMAARGLVGEIAVIAARVGTGGYCTEAQLLEMQAAGWSLVVHGDYDHVTLGSLSACQADIAMNQAYVQRLGGNYLDYVYPTGLIAPSYSFTALRNLGFKSARTTYSVTAALEPHASALAGPLTITAKPINTATGVTALLDWIDVGIRQGAAITIYGHRIVASVTDSANEISQANWLTLVAGIASRCNTSNYGNLAGACTNTTTPKWREMIGLI